MSIDATNHVCDAENVIVLIPSFEPDENLVSLVKSLAFCCFKQIVVVDDGSGERYKDLFNQVGKINGVSIVRHCANCGKGRALKTGFKFILDNFPEAVGVVTCDADGQHLAEDIVKVATSLSSKHREALVLGARDFLSKDVPPKSRFGNLLTSGVFWLLYGRKLLDTQTGLRGIPIDFAKKCLDIDGERFDFEIKMLIEAVRQKIPFVEEKIATVYINSNRATHFRAVVDSFKIYRIILSEFLKFGVSGISSAVLDLSLFALLTKTAFSELPVVDSVLYATVIARICSSLFNYSVNRSFSFRSKEKVKRSLLKYYVLCACQMLVSWLLVVCLFMKLHFDTTVIKIFVDCCLFFISFKIQKHWIF